MEARNRTIEDWFAWIRDGHVVLPRFQRFEAWGGGRFKASWKTSYANRHCLLELC
ncbi:hypothetical protein PhaeoP75_00438 [Phaeobacter gallaeciensis]|uniref:Uncharacterized protein n=1 Tax=Phaeobacter gallaeciensis TaxID=60890 RepID=A0AAD0EA47_9RHOB|nr:hypothetical protein Gal_00440 [Phaeobacter gallaeciensis DSM 26640]ATE91499.1 hypothetical protein PhaeoP11_00437 [Phaeobacter gallaeciensis]ATE95775.1 hypothetical protein PhaeoP73_00438 [Phaeobacter gallaeciensis]ATF00115.1 hypothetical protein PhaeoP75_00438 [Phaeobacter gallaeciensis]ATF04547.1 hypothetical protein PhaeoP63_00438 [Phaeobacter gallaeciensis]